MDRQGLAPWMPASSHPHDPKTPKQRREEALLQPFYEQERRQEDARKIHKLKSMEAACQMRENQRRLILQNFQENVKRRRIRELCAFSVHASLLTSWNHLKNQDYDAKVDVFEKTVSQEDLESTADRMNFEKDLKLFESKGYALGEEATNDTSTSSSKDKGKIKQKDNNKTVKESKESKKEGIDPLAVIKERVLLSERERLQMEQKRKLDALTQKQRQKEVEESIMKEEEVRKASSDIKQKLLDEEECQKEKFKEKEQTIHRLELGQQLAEQRNREWEAVLAQDHELLLMMKHDRDNEINFEQSLWQAERLKKLERKKLKHMLLCEEVLLQIVSLAEKIASYKDATNCVVSSMDWWEWKRLFVKGAVQPMVLGTKNSLTNDTFENAVEGAEEAAVMDYIKEQGEWKVSEPVGTNKELGKILVSLFKSIDPASNALLPSFLASIRLKLAVIGGPFTGKTFVAKVLEEKFGLVRIEIKDMISSAIAAGETEKCKDLLHECEQPQSAFKSNDPTVICSTPLQERDKLEDIKTAYISTRSSLAREAQTAVMNGLQVPDEVVVKLLLLTLENLDDYANTTLGKDKKRKEESSRPQKSYMPSSHGNTSKDKNFSTHEINQANKKTCPGFILDGFPSTQRQAALLEKALRGQELHFGLDKPAYVSIVAPPPDSAVKAVKAEYPLDILFILESLSEGDALKQAMGKVVDPKSGTLYHLEHKPPPPNDRTGIAGRLKPVEEINAAGKRIKEAVPLWSQFYDWISTFSNSYLIYRDQGKKLKMDNVYTRTQEILDAKMKVSAAEDAAKAASEADMAATQSCIEAEKASFQAKAIAQKLFLSKLAELEAFAVLEKDTAAKDVVRKKVSESTSRLLQDAVKAAKEAEGFAEAARKAADDSLNAKLHAEEAASNVSTTIQAREEAYDAAMTAKESMTKACAAAQRAHVAAESASVNVAEMTNNVESTDKNFLKEKVLSLSKQPMKSQNEVEIKDNRQENDIQTVEMDQTLSENLCIRWQAIEATYLQKLKELFGNLSVERQETQKTLKEVKDSVIAYLKKPDERQNYVDDFQGKYNRVDASQRSTPKMQKQLQKKAEDLFSKLHSICEDFFKVAVTTCKTSLTEWTNKRLEAILLVFTRLIEIEFERFLHTCCLVHEYYFKEPTESIKEKFNNLAALSSSGKQSKLLSMPGWLPNISESLPQLYQVLCQAIISIDSVVKVTTEPQTANSSLKSSSKQTKETKKTNPKEQTKSEERDNALRAIQDERQILLSRFERIVSKACSHVSNLDALVEGAKNQMQIWIDKSHKTKLSVTEEVINIVEEAIVESIPLWYYLPLEGENFTIDETRILLETSQPTGIHPLPSLATYHLQVLQELLKAFQENSIKGYVSIEKAVESINKVIESVHSACKNDPTAATIPRMPGTKHRPGGPFEIWRDYSKLLLKMTSTTASGIVDWRCLLVSFMDVHYHSFISTAGVNDIVKAYLALQEASNGSDGYLDLSQYLSVKLWFDSDDGSDAGAEVKTLLYTMLDTGSGMSWKSLLLYLCKDADTEIALKKVHAALTGCSSESVSLSSVELLQAIYPSGIEGALETGCQICSLDDIEKMMGASQTTKKTDLGASETSKALEYVEDDESELYENHQDESNTAPNSIDAQWGSKVSQHSRSSYTSVQSDTQKAEVSSCINQDIWTESRHEEGLMPTLTVPSSELPSAYGSTTLSDISNVSMSGSDKAGGETNEDQYSTELSENALATMKDFLVACDEALKNADEEVSNMERSVEDPVPVGVQVLLASDISPILRARFATDSVLSIPMSIV